MHRPRNGSNHAHRRRSTVRTMAIACAALLAACATAAGATPPAPSGRSTPDPAAGTNDASALRHIDQAALQVLISRTAGELMVPGALVLLRTPQGDFTATYGTTVLGAATPPASGTHFRIASNTKTMTAAVVLLLAQDGKLGLDDPVSRYVAGVPGGDAITISELLDMRSGLYDYTEAPELWATLDREPSKAWTPGELLAIAFAHPATAPPGTGYDYSNTNYALLGVVAEQASGKRLAELMHDRLFVPLGMRQTVLPASTVATLPEPFAHGYGYGGVSVVLSDTAPYPPDLVAAARAGRLQPHDFTELNPSFATAAGGAISTADDLAVWIRALVGGRVLDAASQRRWLAALQPQDPLEPDGQQYGHGISQLRWGPNTMYFHGGEGPGYNSKIAYDPANDLTLVVWTNMAVSLDGQQPANTLMVKVLDRVYQVSPLAPAPQQEPASSRAAASR